MAAASDKKLQSFNAFNSGEYSKDLAGRTDLESFGSSTRYCSNFLSQVTGGLKKFYGTRHITEEAVANLRIKMIPFINKYEPMVFVIYENQEGLTDDGLRVGLIYGDRYKDLNITLPSTIVVNELRWKQINDKLILCHNTIQPIEIDFYGIDDDGEYSFDVTQIEFTEIPYFPIGTTDDYIGELEANALKGNVTLSIPSGSSDVMAYFPGPLTGTSQYVRNTGKKNGTLPSNFEINTSTITLYRLRNGVSTSLVSGTVNNTTYKRYDYKCKAVDTITRERILQVIKSVCPRAYINQSSIVLFGLANHQDGDEYYMTLSVGRIRHYDWGGWVVVFAPASYESVHYMPAPITTYTIDAEDLIGRKIKFYFNDDKQIDPWWQGKSVTSGDYAYSNGHYYRAQSSGTCGNVQPSHTRGIRSDGGVGWEYLHSGSTTATVMSVPSSSQIKIFVPEGELPDNTSNGVNIYKNYAWSIWGKDGVHPSDVYMVGNRLGFICNTLKNGSWNAMSVTDDYFNFSTEEYGAQLDTSAIVHLVGNNESSDINWVLARSDVYMGGYSGEYHLASGTQNKRGGAYTPTTTYVQNISNIGGKSVVPLKYKELNMFVGITGKELYTVGYDYTIDDYTPKSLGYLTQHILNKGIKRLEAVNNLDRNIYILHETQELSLFNYAAEQKILGFTELNFGNDVVDFVSTYSNDEIAAYVAVVRNDCSATISQTREAFGNKLTNLKVDPVKFGVHVNGDCSYSFEYAVSDWYHDGEIVDLADYGISFTGTPQSTDELTVEYISPRITFEKVAIAKPNYMFDEITQGDGETLADFQPIPHFANRTVYIRYGENFSQFVKAELDENGDVSHDPLTGVYLPQATYFKVGLPMVAEMHTQPAFGNKVEGHQQQSLYMYMRIVNSGAFEYGSSVDFTKYFRHEYWNTQQEYGSGHRLFTGDMKLEIPLGYAEAQNQGEGPYPNTSAVGVNIKSDTPEPLNILSIQEIYR